MIQEKITGISGNIITTTGGRRVAIGNADHKIGDWVWVDGGCVFGHRVVNNRVPYIPSDKKYIPIVEWDYGDVFTLHLLEIKNSGAINDNAIAVNNVNLLNTDDWSSNNLKSFIANNKGAYFLDFTTDYNTVNSTTITNILSNDTLTVDHGDCNGFDFAKYAKVDSNGFPIWSFTAYPYTQEIYDVPPYYTANNAVTKDFNPDVKCFRGNTVIKDFGTDIATILLGLKEQARIMQDDVNFSQYSGNPIAAATMDVLKSSLIAKLIDVRSISYWEDGTSALIADLDSSLQSYARFKYNDVDYGDKNYVISSLITRTVKIADTIYIPDADIAITQQSSGYLINGNYYFKTSVPVDGSYRYYTANGIKGSIKDYDVTDQNIGFLPLNDGYYHNKNTNELLQGSTIICMIDDNISSVFDGGNCFYVLANYTVYAVDKSTSIASVIFESQGKICNKDISIIGNKTASKIKTFLTAV